MARYRNPFEKSNISFLGPEPIFCPWPVRYMVSPSSCHHVRVSHPLHSIPPPLFSSTVASAFTTAPRSPACPPPTSSSRPSRTPAYAPPRMRCRSSSPSRATSSPCSRAGSTPTSARRFAQATSTFGRTAAHPRWTMVASPWSGGTFVVAPPSPSATALMRPSSPPSGPTECHGGHRAYGRLVFSFPT